jgi:hypothetical protein
MSGTEWRELKMSRKVMWGLLAVVLVILLSAPSGICDSPSQASGAAEMNCSACHDKQVKSMMDSEMHASAHAKKGIAKCTSCHDAEALKESHANVKPGETKFVKAHRYPQGFCLKCHGTYADLARRTADSKALTDNKGHVVNPHDIPKTPKHGKLAECSNCHKEHKGKSEIMKYCQGCHHTGEFLACNKCHANAESKKK